MKRFQELSSKVYYLPLAYNPDVCKPDRVLEKYGLDFIDTLTSKTTETIHNLRKGLSDLNFFVGNAWQHDIVRMYNQSKIILDISRVGELKARIFEVLGCKRLLLTERSEKIEELFHDKKYLIMYDNVEYLAQIIKEYLADNDERKRIATQEFNEVFQKDTEN